MSNIYYGSDRQIFESLNKMITADKQVHFRDRVELAPGDSEVVFSHPYFSVIDSLVFGTNSEEGIIRLNVNHNGEESPLSVLRPHTAPTLTSPLSIDEFASPNWSINLYDKENNRFAFSLQPRKTTFAEGFDVEFVNNTEITVNFSIHIIGRSSHSFEGD